jgi:hypothetical protein
MITANPRGTPSANAKPSDSPALTSLGAVTTSNRNQSCCVGEEAGEYPGGGPRAASGVAGSHLRLRARTRLSTPTHSPAFVVPSGPSRDPADLPARHAGGLRNVSYGPGRNRTCDLGIKSGAGILYALGTAGQSAWLSEITSQPLGRFWHTLVDLLLTPSVVFTGNVWFSPGPTRAGSDRGRGCLGVLGERAWFLPNHLGPLRALEPRFDLRDPGVVVESNVACDRVGERLTWVDTGYYLAEERRRSARRRRRARARGRDRRVGVALSE